MKTCLKKQINEKWGNNIGKVREKVKLKKVNKGGENKIEKANTWEVNEWESNNGKVNKWGTTNKWERRQNKTKKEEKNIK